MVNNSKGIRSEGDPSIPLEKALSLDILAQVATDVTTALKPPVLPADKDQIAEFKYLVMNELQPCRFTEADRNKRRLKNVVCIGVEYKHCAGKVDKRRFFWSSMNAVESNLVSVHTHMMECNATPSDFKEELGHLKTLRKEHTHTVKLKTGSQKGFFARVWNWKRLQTDNVEIPSALNLPHVSVPPLLTLSQGAVFANALLNVSFPSNSFGKHRDSSPLSSERNFVCTPSPSGEYPLLPLVLLNRK